MNKRGGWDGAKVSGRPRPRPRHFTGRPGRVNSRAGLTIVEMAIVILTMGILIALLASMISSIALLQTSKDEAQLMKESFVFCRHAAIKSNTTVYLEMDIDENKYRAFRYNRTEGKVKKDVFLKERQLADSNGIVAVSLASGAKITSGKVMVPFSPEGVAEEIAVYIGPKPEIRNTVLFSRYGSSAQVVEGEQEQTLLDDTWKADLERR